MEVARAALNRLAGGAPPDVTVYSFAVYPQIADAIVHIEPPPHEL